jgi:hypothetical protein
VENAFFATMVPSTEDDGTIQYSALLGLCAETVGPRMTEPAIGAVVDAINAEQKLTGNVFVTTYTRFFDDARFDAFHCHHRSKAQAFVIFMTFVAVTVAWPWSTPLKQKACSEIYERSLRSVSPALADALLAFDRAYAA